VACPLDDAQLERLAGALSRFEDRQVHINVVVDPSVIGGASVRLGDQVIDGTMLTRLSQARRSIVG
jgi:F-type H+-transporting ATPase subunit delta